MCGDRSDVLLDQNGVPVSTPPAGTTGSLVVDGTPEPTEFLLICTLAGSRGPAATRNAWNTVVRRSA
jgi:hypothetical protein